MSKYSEEFERAFKNVGKVKEETEEVLKENEELGDYMGKWIKKKVKGG